MSLHPFGVDSKNITEGWRPEPTYRGTYGILSSCLLTMGLCIWTAVHLNMGVKHKAMQHFGRKLGWLIIGLFAPELIAWTAFQQHRDAVNLTSAMRTHTSAKPTHQKPRSFFAWYRKDQSSNLLKDEEKSNSSITSSRRYAWTVTHSHFALMGGFAVDVNFVQPNNGQHSDRFRVLTPLAIKHLIQVNPELVPDVSMDAINDKSTASSLAKTIVCLQAMWFCVQCINRLAQNMSISLLELNTAAHALCSLLIYILWWRKPLDVDEPILVELRSSAAKEMIAMWITMEYEDQFVRIGRRETGTLLRSNERMRLIYKAPSLDDPRIDLLSQPGDTSQRRPERLWRLPTLIKSLDASSAAEQYILTQDHHIHGFSLDLSPFSGNVGIVLTEDDVNLLKLAAVGHTPDPVVRFVSPKASDRDQTLPQFRISECTEPISDIGISNDDRVSSILGRASHDESSLSKDSKTPLLGSTSVHISSQINPNHGPFLVDRSRNWPALGTLDNDGIAIHSNAILVGFALAGLLYGIIHLAAWNAPFPSVAEGILWRASAIILIVSPVFLLLGVQGRLISDFDNEARVWFATLALTLVMLFGLCYIAARVFLVAECFRTLVYLPEDAYSVPKWSHYFPHLV